MLRETMIVLATAAALTGGLTAESFARGGGGEGHGGGFGDGGGAHMGGGFGAFPDRIPSVSPHLNPFTPHTLPESRETPVSPASPGSVFGSSPRGMD
jgi:hypothetical protein